MNTFGNIFAAAALFLFVGFAVASGPAMAANFDNVVIMTGDDDCSNYEVPAAHTDPILNPEEKSDYY